MSLCADPNTEALLRIHIQGIEEIEKISMISVKVSHKIVLSLLLPRN